VYKIINENTRGANGPMVLKEYCSRLTFDITCDMVFGYNDNTQKSRDSPFVTCVKATLDEAIDYTSTTILTLFPFMWHMPFGPGATNKKMYDKMNLLLEEMILKGKRIIKDGSPETNLLSHMLKLNIFSDDVIKAQCFAFIIASFETTSRSLETTLMFLAKYPKYQKQLREEIISFMKQPVKELTYESINKMIFLNSFIKESIRLFLTVAGYGRVATKDVDYRKYRIPKGTYVFMNFFNLNRSDEFDRPDEFLP